MTNTFRRTTTTTTTSAASKIPKAVNPYVVGSSKWAKFDKTNYIKYTASRNKMYTTKKRALMNKRPTQSDKDKTSLLIDKILNFIYENGWVQIEGGVNDGKWLNLKHYGNKIFNCGCIFEHSTGTRHYFPIADTYDDPVGVALNYKSIGGGGTFCIVEPNTWKTVGSRSLKKKKRREREIEEDHVLNNDIADKV